MPCCFVIMVQFFCLSNGSLWCEQQRGRGARTVRGVGAGEKHLETVVFFLLFVVATRCVHRGPVPTLACRSNKGL